MDALGWSQAPFRKLRLEPPAAAVVGLHRDGPREGDPSEGGRQPALVRVRDLQLQNSNFSLFTK